MAKAPKGRSPSTVRGDNRKRDVPSREKLHLPARGDRRHPHQVRAWAATACAASRCSRRSRTWDDLTFLPGTLTRFVIEGYREKCETKTVIGPRAKRPLELDIPVYITGMSFGALSYEAKTALARGATMAGTATCSGEGGMIPDERRYLRVKWFYQCIQSRYGFNPHHLRAGRRLRVLHRPGLQGRPRRPPDGPEGDRPGGRDALAAGRHRPAFAGAPPRLARARTIWR